MGDKWISRARSSRLDHSSWTQLKEGKTVWAVRRHTAGKDGGEDRQWHSRKDDGADGRRTVTQQGEDKGAAGDAGWDYMVREETAEPAVRLVEACTV